MRSAHLQPVSLYTFLSSSLGKHIYLNSALIHFWWNQYAWYRKGIWWLCGVGARVWSLKKARTFAISILATQCINNMNRVTKCRFTLRRILLCKWSVKMRGICWLRCHVYMINLWSKNIYMYAIQTIETPITTSILIRDRKPKHTQSTEIHKPANPLKLPNSLCSWYTQTAQPREALRPLSSLKYHTQIHLNMQLT